MSDAHKFERVSWRLFGEYGPVCRWCGETEGVHVVADMSRLQAEFDRAYEASSRLFGDARRTEEETE